MFGNKKMLRAIATVVLTSYTCTAMAPCIAAMQAAPADGQSLRSAGDLVPLAARSAGIEASKALLPIERSAARNAQAKAGATPKSAAPAQGTAYVDALWRMQETVRADAAGGSAAQVNALREQFRALPTLDAAVLAGFAATESRLQKAGAAPAIIARNRAALLAYQTNTAELAAAMRVLDDAATGKTAAASALQGLRRLFAKHPSQNVHRSGKNSALTFGTDKVKKRAVAMTPRAHERMFPRTVLLAAAGSLSNIALPDAVLGTTPVATDLADTADAPLTPEVRALAQRLLNNPVEIYNWVRNNIDYVPGYGVMQGAAGTLEAGRGNAYDIATLLVALNRAAGIPSRYVYGTVEVPAARIQAWLGVRDSAAAQALLNAAGIPNLATLQAGQISTIQLEHMWVEAYADFTPSRGAVNKKPGSWLPLDASFKLEQNKGGLDLRALVSLNEAGLYDAARAGASCTANAAQGVNAGALEQGWLDYGKRLSAALAGQGDDLAVAGVLGTRLIMAESHPILMGSLPYKTVATGAVMNLLPDALRWQFRFQLFADDGAQTAASVELQGSLAELAGKRLTLSFAPATSDDAATLASYMPAAHADGTPVQLSEFGADIPAYLIEMKAELRADGVLVSSGGKFVLGSSLVGDAALFDAATGAWGSSTIGVNAGEYHAFAIDAQGVAGARLDALKNRLAATHAKLVAGQAGALTRDDVTGDVLYQAALGFFATSDANAAVFQRASGAVAQRLPSFGRAVAQVRPHMALGIVHKVSFPGVTLDIDRLAGAVAGQAGGLDALAYQRQANQRDAAYAHLVLNKLFTDAERPGAAVSAINVLAQAAKDGKTMFAVTAANLATVLPQLGIGGEAKAEVENAVGAGYRVLLAQTPLSTGNWNGYAFHIEDTATGAGAYRLLDDAGYATAAIYPTQGMGMLPLAQPFQAAGMAPALRAGQAIDTALKGMLEADGTRWRFFNGQADVSNGLFLARLAGAQGPQPCDLVSGIIAANLGTGTGFDGAGGTVTGAPEITSIPVSAASTGAAYLYPATATDPQGLPLTWRLVDAPGGMTIGATGLLSWSAPIKGDFAVTVRADNGRAYSDQRYMLSVGSAALPLNIALAVSQGIINLGETVTLTVVGSGGTGTVSKKLLVDGQPVALDAQGRAVVSGAAMGAHQILASVSDSRGTVSEASLFSVRNPADTVAPTAEILSPGADVEITAPVNVVGKALDDNLAYYQLLLRPAGDADWQEFGRGTSSVAEGVLGKLDPTQLVNGIYEVMLKVVDVNGKQTSAMVTVDVVRDLKIGQFSVSFKDLNVETSGIPISVTRTYDTMRKGQKLDFGYGWSVDYQSVQVRKNMTMGLGWMVVSRPAQLQTCLMPSAKHKVNITLPTGKVERFVAANTQECGVGFIPPVVIQLTALPGTTGRLEIVDVPSDLKQQGGQLFDMDKLEIWDPKQFKLTTEENYVYHLTDGIGITRIVDPSGNTLTYGQNGIIHSNGLSVAFTRDVSGRITAVTDPAGKRIEYGYSATGDLVSVQDRSGAVSKMTYNRTHGLIDYTDPMGNLAARYTYDADGRLVSVMDAAGKSIDSTHDLASNKEIVKDRRGNTTTFTYDAAGNITEKIDALNHKTTYTYDALGNETSVTDALGKVTLKTYDPQSGKQLSEKDPLGNTTSSEFNSAGRPIKTVDARSNSTSYTYGGNGSHSIKQPLGSEIHVEMDASGNMVRAAAGGQSTRYTYDSKGNKVTETDAAGKVTNYTYDLNNKQIGTSWTRSVAGAQQTVTTASKLDSEGRVIEERDALGNDSRSEYNAGGKLIASTDAKGRTTKYTYDQRLKLTRTTHPDGTSESVSYDEEGNEATTTDREGRVTTYEYDALNRPTKTSYPDGTATSTKYDLVGRAIETTDAKNNRFFTKYDDAGRVDEVTDANNKRTSFQYDPNGNRTKLIDANGKVTDFEYDALNRLVKTIPPDGKALSTSWNVNGTKNTETDGAGNTITYLYDAMARLNKVTQTDVTTLQVTNYGFDTLGNKTSQTDAEGRTTNWNYDAANRVTQRTLPGGQNESFSYDAMGQQSGHISFDGKSTTTSYDVMGQPTLTVRPDGTRISTSYTLDGQVAETTVETVPNSGIQAGTTRYAYDAEGRRTKQTNPDGSFLAYGYDNNGNITERSTKAGTIKYSFGPGDRMSTVTDTTGSTTTYKYDDLGRVDTVTLPNGIATSHVYHPNGRLLQMLHRRADGRMVTGVRYGLADNGQRLLLEEFDEQSTVAADGPRNAVRTSAYHYDSTGRLTQEIVKDRGGAVTRMTKFLYDKVGNRVSKTETTPTGAEKITYSYDSNDRITQESKETVTGSIVNTLYSWDSNGNLTGKGTGTEKLFYDWNGDGRLVAVRKGPSDAAAVLIVRYDYDSGGNRVLRVEPRSGSQDRVTTYLVDAQYRFPVLAQEDMLDASGGASTRYVWGRTLLWSNLPGHLNRWRIHHLRRITWQGNANHSIQA